jgi:hypothetical protein
LFALLFNSLPALTAAASAGQIPILAWNPSPAFGVAGCHVYYGGTSRAYTNMINAGNVTNAAISGLVAGMTYYFATTVHDDLGYESAYSSEISFTVPGLPTGQIRGVSKGPMVLTLSGPMGQAYNILARRTSRRGQSSAP